ncbi:hypothetical protein L228DRAFT_270591 [Xylona heveae TC161]|uniref:Myb-like domain-containing protein n=1 Tax=Xylona heveae (strain CBS 132557 / TC161) TaxID=1328760 RepID=A0A165A179_XYLHT|nr:hypothetical protein L228DRAFT_270591 [Xylona heveae TC161]KZF19811.1 hypothetical protein L228DRAFT_270591 [Xylona heveae TC161]
MAQLNDLHMMLSDIDFGSDQSEVLQCEEHSRFANSRSTPATSDATTTTLPSISLTEDEKRLLSLRDVERKSWKEIALYFQSKWGKKIRTAALQMRYSRLQRRLRAVNDTEISSLQHAHDHWTTHKWKLISEMMHELGCDRRWTPEYCAFRWRSLKDARNG